MIKRLWHGWTTKKNADRYFEVLSTQVIPSIEAKNIKGYRKFEVLRKEYDDEVEFLTQITFDSLQNVIEFQGDDYTRAYVPEAAQALLKRWDEYCVHYDVLDQPIKEPS
jgi:heme-degrading monooxygenase HmoA